MWRGAALRRLRRRRADARAAAAARRPEGGVLGAARARRAHAPLARAKRGALGNAAREAEAKSRALCLRRRVVVCERALVARLRRARRVEQRVDKRLRRLCPVCEREPLHFKRDTDVPAVAHTQSAAGRARWRSAAEQVDLKLLLVIVWTVHV